MTMTPEQQQAFNVRIMKAMAFEWVCLLIGVYFLMSFTTPDTLTGFGLPILVQGMGNLVIFFLAVALGTTPLLRVVMSHNKNKP